MSSTLISRSPDLRRLRDEGYELTLLPETGHLLLGHVPYVTEERVVAFGTIVTSLTLAGDVTTTPADHIVFFQGAKPCNREGHPLIQVINSSNQQTLAPDLVIDHVFSCKPPEGYVDYHAKLTAYVEMLASPARSLQPDATARTCPLIEADPDADGPFAYVDTHSSRAGIGDVSAKLALNRVAIVGLGGTGAYVLDYVAKTPVREIHLFDGDEFLQHNAFRTPGAASAQQLREKPMKVDYLAGAYSNMHRGLVPHRYFVDEGNAEELGVMDFVFVCVDDGPAKRPIVDALEAGGVPFIDVGMGIWHSDGRLGGVLRTTTSTPQRRGGRERISFAAPAIDDAYDRNVQISELNGLNAAMAVIRFKKHFGFYADFDREHHAIYTIDGNQLLNEDAA